VPDLPPNTESDELIMRRFCASLDEQVFQILAVRYYDRARWVAQARLGSESLAQDAVQETFIRIVRHRKRYDHSKPFSQWFYTVLRNVCTDFYRKEARHQQALNTLAEIGPVSDQHEPARTRVRELVAALPLGDAELLRIRYLDGLSYQEISQRLNCSLAAAKKRVQRLLKRLKPQAAGV
jgi:RNA polymerase sigma-70 factor (ECF subfamily)